MKLLYFLYRSLLALFVFRACYGSQSIKECETASSVPALTHLAQRRIYSMLSDPVLLDHFFTTMQYHDLGCTIIVNPVTNRKYPCPFHQIFWQKQPEERRGIQKYRAIKFIRKNSDTAKFYETMLKTVCLIASRYKSFTGEDDQMKVLWVALKHYPHLNTLVKWCSQSGGLEEEKLSRYFVPYWVYQCELKKLALCNSRELLTEVWKLSLSPFRPDSNYNDVIMKAIGESGIVKTHDNFIVNLMKKHLRDKLTFDSHYNGCSVVWLCKKITEFMAWYDTLKEENRTEQYRIKEFKRAIEKCDNLEEIRQWYYSGIPLIPIKRVHAVYKKYGAFDDFVECLLPYATSSAIATLLCQHSWITLETQKELVWHWIQRVSKDSFKKKNVTNFFELLARSKKSMHPDIAHILFLYWLPHINEKIVISWREGVINNIFDKHPLLFPIFLKYATAENLRYVMKNYTLSDEMKKLM